MSENDKTYNGWDNYETWLIRLHQDNDQQLQNRCIEMAKDAWREADPIGSITRSEAALFRLMDKLKDWMEDLAIGAIPDRRQSRPAELLAMDLIRSALQTADWYEIANSWLKSEAAELKDYEPREKIVKQ